MVGNAVVIRLVDQGVVHDVRAVAQRVGQGNAAHDFALLYLGVRRSRYFGNTLPLVMSLLLLPLMTTQTVSAPWLWALPFLFTFLGGVFADALETRQRRMFLALTGVLLVAQEALCVMVLPAIAR